MGKTASGTLLASGVTLMSAGVASITVAEEPITYAMGAGLLALGIVCFALREKLKNEPTTETG